jgi:hypothetical protein
MFYNITIKYVIHTIESGIGIGIYVGTINYSIAILQSYNVGPQNDS